MTGIQNFFVGNTSRSGYAKGNGGTIRIRLVSDSGGMPNMSNVLAETTWIPNLVDGRSRAQGATSYRSHPTDFADKYWNSPSNITRGQRYHVVFENIHPDKLNNFMSINSPFDFGTTSSRGPLAPSNGAWGVTIDRGSGFQETTSREALGGPGRYEPNLMVLMSNGRHFGNAYIETKSDYQISGANKLRQNFSPGSTQSVDQLQVFASGSGTLRVQLKENGTEIGNWTVNASGSGWSHYLINTGSLDLRSGRNYLLEFSAVSGSMKMSTYRDGSEENGYPFPDGGTWDDGHSEFSSGGGWSDTFLSSADITGVAFSLR